MTRSEARRTLVAYDIPDDKRRVRVAKALQAFGDRVQYSVFIVDASPVRLARMKREVSDIIKFDEDSLLMCDLGPCSSKTSERFTVLGRSRDITDVDSFIL